MKDRFLLYRRDALKISPVLLSFVCCCRFLRLFLLI